MSKIVYHVTPMDNVGTILENGLEPRIGERSLQRGEETPRVYLFPQREDVETALMNWLGDEFEDELAIVEVDLAGYRYSHDVGYEISVEEVIKPSAIMAVYDENFDLVNDESARII